MISLGRVFHLPLLTVFAGLFVLSADGAAGPTITLSTGADVSSGDYGLLQTTDIVFLPMSLTYEEDRWSLKASWSYLQITGPALVTAGSAPSGVRPSRIASETVSGFGDLNVGATYKTDVTFAGLNYVDLTAKVKIPTADEDHGLGTGEADYTLLLDVFRSHPPWTPFATFGYRFIGDNPQFNLHDAALASVGLDYRYSGSFSGGAILSYRESISNSSDDSLEIVPYIGWRPVSQTRFSSSAYLVLGLTHGSPDTAVGLQFSYQLSH